MTGISLDPTLPDPGVPVIHLAPGESADVTVDDSSLSRLHARVSMDSAGQFTVDDIGSTNGVFVNGAEQLSASVRPGDVVRFGRVEYLVAARDDSSTGVLGPPSDRPDDSSAGALDPLSDRPIVSQTILRRVAMTAAPKVDGAALDALLATSREMMAFSDLPALLERVLDRLMSIVKPDRAAILLVDSVTGTILPRAVRPSGAYSSVSEFASSTVVHQALTARDMFIVHDIQSGSAAPTGRQHHGRRRALRDLCAAARAGWAHRRAVCGQAGRGTVWVRAR